MNHDQVTAAKAATALLVTSDGSGSAFCISESGLFVTCDHVIAHANPGSIALVLSPTQKDEKRFPATVVRRLKDQDPAILKATLDRKIPVLPLGDVGGLFETQPLFAFGYPFGKALAVDEKSYPSISVNVGRITALRKKGEVLDVIQLDAQLNPGNSGGPVLDDTGKVVGIVAAGLVASGINFATPVSLLAKGLDSPMVTVTPGERDAKHPSKPLPVKVNVDWVFPPAKEPTVAVEIQAVGQSRRIPVTKGKDGAWHAEIADEKEAGKPGPTKLKIAVLFDQGRIDGTIEDRSINIAGKPKSLHELTELKRAPDGPDLLFDGKPIGNLEAFKALHIEVGGAPITVDASKARQIFIEAPPAAEPPRTTYKAVVTLADGHEYFSEEKVLTRPVAPSAPAPIVEAPVALSGAREISLPASISDVIAADDGHALILQLKDAKKLAVFDVANLTIRGYINLVDGQAVVAAGAKYILVISPSQSIVERFSVRTLERERTISNSFGNIGSFTMGRSSPRIALLVAGGTTPGSFNLMAFDADKMAVETTAPKELAMRLYSPNAVVRASADGHTFGISQLSLSPNGITVLSYRDGAFSHFYEHVTCGILVPGDDGTRIYTSTGGLFTDKYVALIQGSGNWAMGTTYLPSYSPMYYLGLPYSHVQGEKGPRTLAIYLQGSTQPLLQMPEEFKEMQTSREVRLENDHISLDKRYHFFPQYDLLLTIPPTNN